jgi:hypothetical protein
MFVLMGACWMYAIAIVLARVRLIIKERERDAPWLVEEVAA